MTDSRNDLPAARPAVRQLPVSRIREVANAGIGNPDVLAFWFGEPDGVTPRFIRDAAAAALEAGDTFYSHNLGTPTLREALSRYLGRWHRPVAAERIAVTSAGVNALMLAAQMIVSPGDRVVAVVPLWPNITEIPRILGAEVVRVPLHPDAQGRWVLDIERLLLAITPGTRAVIINSPGNPTGWVMPQADMSALLDHARRTGTWIISDEAYERLVFGPEPETDGTLCAASMLDLAEPDDRVIVANTFSKAWQMTGWRLGWLVVPPSLLDDLGKLIEFNTSCAPGFVQQAAVTALDQGESHVRAFVHELRARRDTLEAALAPLDRLQVGSPEGAMYLFFKVAGVTDTLALAKELVREAGLGLAPGSAFGSEGEGYLRWCFAKPAPMLEEGARRLAAHLRR
ncbi:MAG TPA: pyridoxal phosphate-dependent aminotransferase [Burkholderiaceae bacterium]|nr:pyridoxal phosphate-dependent aminotransferase [Burkholderiaceae bacterium]